MFGAERKPLPENHCVKQREVCKPWDFRSFVVKLASFSVMSLKPDIMSWRWSKIVVCGMRVYMLACLPPRNLQVSKEVVHELEFGDIAVIQI